METSQSFMAMQATRFRASVLQVMVVIAVIGLIIFAFREMSLANTVYSAVFALREMFLPNTVYSARYNEKRFEQVYVGMTSAEVEALLGRPLDKVPWLEAGGVRYLHIWLYTDRRHKSGDYWRRNVVMKGGKVFKIINMYEQD